MRIPQWFLKEIHLFSLALTFLTRIPLPLKGPFSENELNQSLRYFPLVGTLVGLFGGFWFWYLSFFFEPSISLLLSMTSTILLTGAFHEDGFSDFCDAFGGGMDQKKILKIMKDSRIGTFGTTGLFLILFLKYLSLRQLPSPTLPLFLMAGHSFSRFAALTTIFSHEYVRDDSRSKTKPVAQNLKPADLFIACLFGILPLFFLESHFFLLIIPVFLFKWIGERTFLKRIGGYTGDCLGAVQQVTETVFYLFAGIL